MATYLDLDSWKRREHFRFFKGFDNPYFNICANVDVTALREVCRQPDGPSFFLASLYLSIKAANEIEAFRYRIRGDRVRVHEVIHASSTILRPDETFGFGYFDYQPDFRRFYPSALALLKSVRDGNDKLDPRSDQDDMIHYSVIPWVAFTSFSHARRWGTEESIPKLVFGKHFQDGARRRMAVSVEVHHALMDGLEVGRYFERFQSLLDAPDFDGQSGAG